jgi:hypothetical protein
MVEPLGRISYVSTLMPSHVPYLDLIWSRGIFTMSMLIPIPYPLIMSPSGSTLLSNLAAKRHTQTRTLNEHMTESGLCAKPDVLAPILNTSGNAFEWSTVQGRRRLQGLRGVNEGKEDSSSSFLKEGKLRVVIRNTTTKSWSKYESSKSSGPHLLSRSLHNETLHLYVLCS